MGKYDVYMDYEDIYTGDFSFVILTISTESGESTHSMAIPVSNTVLMTV